MAKKKFDDILGDLTSGRVSIPTSNTIPSKDGSAAMLNVGNGADSFTFPKTTPWPTDTERDDLNQEIDELGNKVDKAGKGAYGRVVDRTSSRLNFVPPFAVGDPSFRESLTDSDVTDTRAAKKTVSEANELANATTDRHSGSGFFKGVYGGFDPIGVMTAGGKDALGKGSQAISTYNITKKVKAGIPLSSNEQLFVDAIGLRSKADALVQQEGGKTAGYQIGNIVGAMPEFVAQLGMTAPYGAGAGSAMEGIQWIAKGVKAGAPLWRKGLTLAGIELGKASVVTPLQPMFASAFADQELKQYSITRDANGEVVAERSNPQSVGTSLAKAFAQTLTENWSEGMGDIFGKAGSKVAQGIAKSRLGVRMAGSQLGSTIAKASDYLSKTTGAIGATADDFGLGGVRAFTKDVMKWHGTLEEIAEEEFNMVVQPLLMGEPDQLKQILDPKQQLVTALSCAVAGVGFKALEVPGYVQSGIAIKQNKDAYQQNIANLRPDIASQVVNAFGEQDIEARGNALAALPWAEMQPAEREQVVNAVWHRTRYDFLRGAKAASDAEQALNDIHSRTENVLFRGSESHPVDGGSMYTATLPSGTPAAIVDGDIRMIQDADGNARYYTAPNGRKPVVVTPDGRRIMVDHNDLQGISMVPRTELVSQGIDSWMQQQDVDEEQQDAQDAEEDMQAASLTPALPEEQAEVATAPSETQPAVSSQPSHYTPKVGDTVQTPSGIVGDVVQVSTDHTVVSYVDENGEDQIELLGPHDELQPYVEEQEAPTQEEAAVQEEQPLQEEAQVADGQPAEPQGEAKPEVDEPVAATDVNQPTEPVNSDLQPIAVVGDSNPTDNNGVTNVGDHLAEVGNSVSLQDATLPQAETAEEPSSARGQENEPISPVGENGSQPRTFPELAKEILSTVNDEPSMEAPHYVSKNRKYLFTIKDGNLIILDRNGIEIPSHVNGKANQQYTRLAKEYKEVFDYSKGEEGTAEGATSEAEVISMLIRSSLNPLELANLYLSETARGNDLVKDAEDSVVGVILEVAQAHRVSKAGFEEWADPNFTTGTIAKTYFSKDGLNPSDIAALATAQLRGEWDATSEMVTAADVVQAMVAYPRGEQDLQRSIKDGTAAKEAADAFRDITGFDITPAVVSALAKYQSEAVPSVLPEDELQQMADDEWQSRIDAARQAGIDMAAEQYGAFLEPVMQQNENPNVEQNLNNEYHELPATQEGEGTTASSTTKSGDGGEQEGDEGASQQPATASQSDQEVSLSHTQQAEYDRSRTELSTEIADLTQRLGAARKAKDKAINEAQLRNGLFGDTASDPQQATIDGGAALDVRSGVNTITKQHNETIAQLSKAIEAKKKELAGLRDAVKGQAELFGEHPTASEEISPEPKEQLDVQNHTTSTPEASVEEEQEKLGVQKYTANKEAQSLTTENTNEKPVPPAIGSDEAVRNEQDAAFRSKLPSYVQALDNIKRLYRGELTLDQYKQAFKELQDSKDAIIDELGSNTKDVLLALMGSYERYQYKNEKKDRIVNVLYQNLLMEYAFNSISYDFRTPTDVAIARKVESTTQNDLIAYTEDVKRRREDRKREHEAKQKALENPETLDEFRVFIAKKGIKALSDEQLEAFDKLRTQATLKQRAEKKAEPAKAEPVAVSTEGLTLHETKHTKTGEPLFVVQLPERVSKEEYQTYNSRAKSLGGYYSSYRGNGAIPGFTFKSIEQAEAFMGSAESRTEKEEAQEPAAPTAQKLRELGEKVVEAANEALNRDRLTNTVKRAREAEYADSNARKLMRIGQTMINIANAVDAGDDILVGNIKAKTHVELLESILASAKWRLYNDKEKSSSYKDREAYLNADPTEAVLRYVQNEYLPRIYKDNMLRMVRAALNVKGMKQQAARWEKGLSAFSGEYFTPKNEQQVEELTQMMNALPEKERVSVIEDQLANHRRLKAMGIENESMLRELLREYLKLRATAVKEDEVKRLERELVGSNVGFDFFPTPKVVVDRMVDEADIREGMDVLEPSAGNGNIADGVRETGVEPDVVELSSALAKVLEAKGFNVVGDDFMGFNEKKYDRIVMNPPFSNGMDGEHIRHAYDLLKPGGKVVAIAGEGIFFRSDKKSAEFRDWLESVGGYSEKLPEGTFTDRKLLNTTGANSRLVVIEKPEESNNPDDRITYSRSAVAKAGESVKEASAAAKDAAQRLSEAITSIEEQHTNPVEHIDGTVERMVDEATAGLREEAAKAEDAKREALGVLVQARRVENELPQLVDELQTISAPIGGWTVESAQAFLDEMKAKYPTAGEAIAVADANEAADTMLKMGYSKKLSDRVRGEQWDGVTLPDGRVILRVDNPSLHIAATWAHEQGHSLMTRMFDSKDRMDMGEAVCNAIGVREILAYIGHEYASEPIWLIGEEYLMHRVADIASGQPITAAPASVSELLSARHGANAEQVEQIISTLVAQILKKDGNKESEWNGNDFNAGRGNNDALQQDGNAGAVRSVREAHSGRNVAAGIVEANRQGYLHQERVAAAEEHTDTNPSEAQKDAGNYRKGKARVLGMEISIENPQGGIRSGVDPNGKAWSITMPYPYGYILGTVGMDKDHIDVYLGRNLTKDTPIFIVNQVNPSTGAFDEHKVMMGFPSYSAAKRAYLSAYEQGWQGFGSMGQMSVDEFKEWVFGGNKGPVKPTKSTEELGESREFVQAWHADDLLGMPADFASALAFARRRSGDVRTPDKQMDTLNGSKVSELRENVQDATLRVRKLQEKIDADGGRVPFAANAWEALNRYTSAAKAKMDYFEQQELTALIEKAGELCKRIDATWDELGDYLLAKHGIGRQEVGGVSAFSDEAGAEWTLDNAKRIVEEFEKKATPEDIAALWEAVRSATTASLKALVDGGMISQKDADAYLSRPGWEHYVPLRDFDVNDELKADDVFEYSESRNPGKGTFVKATQTAKGRTSKPGNPIPQIAAMFASSVALAEKNRAKQALLNLVRLNPNRGEYTVTRSWYVLDNGTNTTLEVFEKPQQSLIDLQNVCLQFFTEPDMQVKNAMAQRIKDLRDTAINDGADANLVGLVMRQGMKDGIATISAKQHKSSILGETNEQDRQHMVAVFEDGVKYVIWMQDAELAAAVNHTNINSKFNETWIGRVMGGMNRWLSVNFTGKNPAFIPINWMKDMQYATISHLIRHDGEAARMAANVGKAASAIHRYMAEKANPLTSVELAGYSLHNPVDVTHLIKTYGKGRVTDTLYQQYRNNGGETGYIHTDDIRMWTKRLRRHLEREMGTNPTLDKLKQAGSKYTGLRAAGHLLDYAAYQSENMTRFATFLASWEQGKGFAESASDAKNITVNFNRKGRNSGVLNSLLVFFNATIQGTDNLLDRILLPNKGRFAVAASLLFATSLTAATMALSAYGDDEDNPYWRMPEYVRYNSILIPTYGIGGKEKYIIIPLPPGLRFINGWSVAAMEGYYGRKTPMEVGAAMASSVIDNTSPIGVKGGDLTRSIIPSVGVPIYDIATNKDYAGRTVYREMFTPELRDNTPNSQQGSRNVNEAFAWFAEKLNALGGGSATVPAGVDPKTGKLNSIKRFIFDWNPSKLEHLLTYFAGGRGQFFMDCYRTARPAWDKEQELEARNIPVVRRLWGGANEASDAKAFYERVDNLNRYEFYLNSAFKNNDPEAVKLSLTYPEVYRWAAMGKVYQEQIQDLAKTADAKGVTLEQRKRLLDQRKVMMRQFLDQTEKYEQPEDKRAKQ